MRQQRQWDVCQLEARANDGAEAGETVFTPSAQRVQADDVARLMAQYRHSTLSYHEIRQREAVRAIQKRWPLLAELSDTL